MVEEVQGGQARAWKLRWLCWCCATPVVELNRVIFDPTPRHPPFCDVHLHVLLAAEDIPVPGTLSEAPIEALSHFACCSTRTWVLNAKMPINNGCYLMWA